MKLDLGMFTRFASSQVFVEAMMEKYFQAEPKKYKKILEAESPQTLKLWVQRYVPVRSTESPAHPNEAGKLLTLLRVISKLTSVDGTLLQGQKTSSLFCYAPLNQQAPVATFWKLWGASMPPKSAKKSLTMTRSDPQSSWPNSKPSSALPPAQDPMSMMVLGWSSSILKVQ